MFERIWCRNKSHFNRSQYIQKVHQYNRICMQDKSEFLKANIQNNHHDHPKLWRVLGDVLHRLPAKMLPSVNPKKLKKIRSVFFYFPEVTTHLPRLSSPMLSTFSTVSEDQVTKIIMNSQVNHVPLILGQLFLLLTIWIFSSPPSLQ